MPPSQAIRDSELVVQSTNVLTAESEGDVKHASEFYRLPRHNPTSCRCIHLVISPPCLI